MCYACSDGVFYRNSAMTCERTSVFLTIYFNKKFLHSVRGVLSVLSPQSENERLLLDVIIYIIWIYYIYYKLIFLIKHSVNNGLRTEDTEDTIVPCHIQDVEIKHYTLSGTIFGHLSHPLNPYWTGWLSPQVFVDFSRERWTMGGVFERLSFNVERRGVSFPEKGWLYIM